jgi:hypothetical protein
MLQYFGVSMLRGRSSSRNGFGMWIVILDSSPPKSGVFPKDGIIGLDDFLIVFSGAGSMETELTSDAITLGVGIEGSGQLIPNLEKESSVIGFVVDGLGVMDIVLIAGVDDGVMGIEGVEFVTTVQVDAVKVEEDGISGKEEFHVDGKEERQNDHGHGSHKLVDEFVGNDGKGGRIEENVVVSMDFPKGLVDVPQAVVAPLVQVR